MSISVRPSIDPAEIGVSPAHGTHSAHGTLGLPGARRHGA